jgi:hypothetical protein
VAGPAWLTKLGLWLRQPVDFWWISTVNFGPTFGVVVGIWFSNGDPPIVIVAALVGALFAFCGLFNFISNRRDAAVWFLVVVLTLAGESVPTSSGTPPPAKKRGPWVRSPQARDKRPPQRRPTWQAGPLLRPIWPKPFKL